MSELGMWNWNSSGGGQSSSSLSAEKTKTRRVNMKITLQQQIGLGFISHRDKLAKKKAPPADWELEDVGSEKWAQIKYTTSLIERKKNASSIGLFLYLPPPFVSLSLVGLCAQILMLRHARSLPLTLSLCVGIYLSAFCLCLSFSLHCCFFLSPSSELRSGGKVITSNNSPKHIFILLLLRVRVSHEPLQLFFFFVYWWGGTTLAKMLVLYFNWAGSRHCLPLSGGANEAHQARLAIAHITSAREG